MKTTFYNNSKFEILIKQASQCKILYPKQEVQITLNKDISFTLAPYASSNVKEFLGVIVSYNMFVESTIRFSTEKDDVRILIDVITVLSDEAANYTYVSAQSNDLINIDVEALKVLNEAECRKKVLSNKNYLKRANKKNKKFPTTEIVLDTLVGGVPLVCVFFFVLKNVFNPMVAIVTNIVLLAIVFSIAFLVNTLIDKTTRRSKRCANDYDSDEFSHYCNEQYIFSVINDSSRYKKYE